MATDLIARGVGSKATKDIKTLTESSGQTHQHLNMMAINNVVDTGDGTKFLNDKGMYEEITGGGDVNSVNGQIGTVVLTSDDIEDTTDTKKFVTQAEKNNFHTHINKTVLDNTTASFTTAEKTKLSGIADNANNYSLPTASGSTLGGIKIGANLSIDANGVVSASGSGGVSSVNTKTGDVTLTTNDIADSTDKRYVTDIDITKLENTSGVNTGDQDLSILEPKLPVTPSNPENKFLNGNKEWAEITVGGGSGGYAANLYPTTISSDVAGYYKLSYINELTETVRQYIVNNQELQVNTSLYPDPIGITTIDAGIWSARMRLRVSSSVGITRSRVEVFLRHLNGTETTLFTASSAELNNTVDEFILTETNQPAYACLETDRLGIRHFISTTSNTNITVYVTIGDGYASYINTPIALRHSQLRDLNGQDTYQHITLTQKNELHTHTNKTSLDNVSGTNTGDETNSSIITKIGYTPEDSSKKGQALGYCSLDGGSKVPLENLPASLLKYIGTWNASTNTPTLTNPDLTKVGNVYNVGVAGTQFGITFGLGDWLIYNNNGIPEKSDNADDVVSVNGKTGTVVLTTDDVADSSNKRYITDAQQIVLSNISGTNTGDETATSIGTLVNSATAKDTPVNTDMVPLMDSAASNIIKKLSWLNIKATLKTYFDTLYAAITHTHTLSSITDITASATELNYCDGLISNAQAQFGYITGNIAPVYSTTSTYAIGDLVLYNYVLYECIVAITIPQATFVPERWSKVNLSERFFDIYNTNTTAYTGSLNDLPAGLVWCSASAINVPIANSGYCTTIFGIAGYKSQTYTTNTTRAVYVRAMAGSVWGAWAKLPYIEDVYTKKNITTFSGGDVRTLKPGITWCDNTCTNLPVTDDWGLMTVTAGDSTQTILSLEFRGITKNTIYVCTYVNDIWTPWTCVSSDRITSTTLTAGTYCTNTKTNIEQAGRFCHLSTDILLDRTAKGSDFAIGYIIATLAAEYRPLTIFWCPCIILGYGGATVTTTYVQISTNGAITINMPFTSNAYIMLDTSFMTR